jgi:hypothetical protein
MPKSGTNPSLILKDRPWIKRFLFMELGYYSRYLPPLPPLQYSFWSTHLSKKIPADNKYNPNYGDQLGPNPQRI